MRFFLPVLIFLIGWGAGIIVNYLADMLPRRRKLSAPYCLHCGLPYSSLWNYSLWPKRCPHCGHRRGMRVRLVELLVSGTALWLWYQPRDDLPFHLGFSLLAYFAVVLVIDIEHRLILHPVSLVGGFLGLGIGIYLHGAWTTLLGGVGGFVIMLALYYFGDVVARLIAKRRGLVLNEVALGFGDVNLAGVIGLLLGWPGVIAGLFLAIMVGGLVSFLYLLFMLATKRYKTFAAVPYAPFLIFGVIYLLYLR